MTSHERPLDVLDKWFPYPLTMPASCFWEMAHLRPDRPALPGLAARARADEATYQERFVRPAPRFVPALTHEDPAGDCLPRGWWRDTFAREGMPQPEGTDTFLVACQQADQDEQERRTVRRTLSRVVDALRQQPPSAGAL